MGSAKARKPSSQKKANNASTEKKASKSRSKASASSSQTIAVKPLETSSKHTSSDGNGKKRLDKYDIESAPFTPQKTKQSTQGSKTFPLSLKRKTIAEHSDTGSFKHLKLTPLNGPVQNINHSAANANDGDETIAAHTLIDLYAGPRTASSMNDKSQEDDMTLHVLRAEGPPSTRTRSALVQQDPNESLPPNSRRSSVIKESDRPQSGYDDVGVTQSTLQQLHSSRAPVAVMARNKSTQAVSAEHRHNGNSSGRQLKTTMENHGDGELPSEAGHPSMQRGISQDIRRIKPPDTASQPILSKEFNADITEKVSAADFMGSGDSWNRILDQRRNLLSVWQDHGVQYPMTQTGQELFELLVEEPQHLLEKHEKIEAFTSSLSEKVESNKADFARDELCHLIIPRMIRCIDLVSKRFLYFLKREDLVKTMNLSTCSAVVKLFEILEQLSKVAHQLEFDDSGGTIVVGVDENVSDTLDQILSEAREIQERLVLLCADVAEAQRRRKLEERKRDREQRRRQKERKAIEQAAAQRQNEEILEQAATQRRAKNRAREELFRKKKAAIHMDGWINAQKQQEEEEDAMREIEARKQLDAIRMRMREDAAADFWTRTSEHLLRRRPRFRLQAERRLDIAPRSSTNQIAWTKELSQVLIGRLAEFRNLDTEARYARCLDCEELQTMSIEMVRDRAIEMRPTLEDWYTSRDLLVPRWIRSIE